MGQHEEALRAQGIGDDVGDILWLEHLTGRGDDGRRRAALLVA